MSKDIENIFKQKFENFESAPSADLLDKIQNARSKKKRAIWIWSSAAVIASAGIIGLLLIDFDSEKSNNREITQLEIGLLDNTELNTASENFENQNNEQSTGNIAEGLSKKQNNAFDQVRTPNEGLPSLENEKLDKTPLKASTESTSPQKQIANAQLADLFQKIASKTDNTNLEGGTLYHRNLVQQLSEAPSIVSKSMSDLSSNLEFKPNDLTLNDESNSDEKVQETDFSENDNLITKEETEEKEDKNKKLPIYKLVDKSRWSISASAGLGIGGRSLSGNSLYVENRNNTEFQQLSNAVDLRLIYDISPKWSIQFGINRAERNENFFYEESDKLITVYREEERTETVIHPVLGTYTRTYTVTVEEEQLEEGKTYNSNNVYTNVTIPISLERELYSNKYVAVMARSGILIGISSKASGENLNQENKVFKLNSETYRTSGINFAHIGIGAALRASDRVSLIAYPEYRFGLNSAYNGTIINQREFAFYTDLGIRIRL